MFLRGSYTVLPRSYSWLRNFIFKAKPKTKHCWIDIQYIYIIMFIKRRLRRHSRWVSLLSWMRHLFPVFVYRPMLLYERNMMDDCLLLHFQTYTFKFTFFGKLWNARQFMCIKMHSHIHISMPLPLYHDTKHVLPRFAALTTLEPTPDFKLI